MTGNSADGIRAQLRVLQARGDDGWLALCDDAIRGAQRRGDVELVATLSLLAAVGLDARGRLAEALARLDVGLAWAPGGTAAHAHLWLTRAGILAVAGRIEAARAALDRAEASHTPTTTRARLERLTYRTHVGAVALDEIALQPAQGVVAEAQRAGLDWLASGLVVWLVPWLAAHGQLAGAAPWIDWLQAASERARHGNRGHDAAALRYLTTLGTAGGALPVPTQGTNRYAAWRTDLGVLYIATRGGEPAVAERVVASLGERLAEMSPGFADGHHAFVAVARAFAGLDLLRVSPPRVVTLVTLPAWIAGAEAVAMAGTRVEAARWRHELAARLPAAVATSLEWPARVARVRALLALRAGDRFEAAMLLRSAIDESSRRHASVEGAIAVLQLHALERRGGRHAIVPVGSVEASRAFLEERGVAVDSFIEAVTRATSTSHPAVGPSLLTPREVDVLAGLEAGLTYRQIGARLGIGWRTAQTHAYRIYRKLGASGRRAAVQEARLRRII